VQRFALEVAASTTFSVHLDHAASAKARGAYRPLRVLAYDLLRAAIDEGSIATISISDLLATFLLSSVRSVTKMTVAGSGVAQPSGEELWQLVSRGVATWSSSQAARTSIRERL
jgi:hypothetical protein